MRPLQCCVIDINHRHSAYQGKPRAFPGKSPIGGYWGLPLASSPGSAGCHLREGCSYGAAGRAVDAPCVAPRQVLSVACRRDCRNHHLRHPPHLASVLIVSWRQWWTLIRKRPAAPARKGGWPVGVRPPPPAPKLCSDQHSGATDNRVEGLNLDALGEECRQALRLIRGEVQVIAESALRAGDANREPASAGGEYRIPFGEGTEGIGSGELCHRNRRLRKLRGI
jgi:hypothetical protein